MAQDLITALVVRPGALEWTTLREMKKTGWQAEPAASRPLPDGVACDPATAELQAELTAAAPQLRGDISLALSCEKALMRVVDLPTADPAEMRSMAELQVDKFSPFPTEHMFVSLELLEQKEATSRLLIVALQKDVVEAWGAALGKAKLLPRWIDLEVLGWWHLMKKEGEVPAQGRAVFVLLERATTDVIVTQDAVPVVFRSLGPRPENAGPEFIGELAEEIAYTLTSLETERGAAETKQLSVWHWDEMPPEMLAHSLCAACGLEEAKTRSFASLPPLTEGLARRASAKDGLTLDLAPPAWHAAGESRKLRHRLLVATGVFLLVWLVGLGAFLGAVKLQQGRLNALKADVAALEGPAEEIRSMNARIESFEQYADRSHSALECLREISAVLPAGIDLTRFKYDKGESVDVDGQAPSPEPFYDFFSALQQSKLFTKVAPGDIRTDQSGRSRFTVRLTLPKQEEGSTP